MRFETTKGVFLTAATQEDAAILAAQYNMGDIARVLPAAPSAKPRSQMSVATASVRKGSVMALYASVYWGRPLRMIRTAATANRLLMVEKQ